jgi:hypothetical protein
MTKKLLYKFINPEVISMDKFVEEFIPEFSELDEASRQKSLQVYSWTPCFGPTGFWIYSPACEPG